MSWIEDFIAIGLQRRDRQDPYREDRRRWDSGGSSIWNLITGQGGYSDKGSAGRPNPMVLPLSWLEIESLWAHNGIARKIIEIKPDRATRKGWEINHLPESEEQRLRLQGNIYEGMVWGNLYGGALGLMVTEDDVPPEYRSEPSKWWRQPLDLERVGKFHAIQIFDVYDCSPREWDDDPTGNNYRMPSIYNINAEGFSADVHHSRVLHFRGARRPPSWRRHGFRNYHNFPDVSVVQAIWDDIARYTQIMQGGATLAQELRQHVLKIGAYKNQMTGSQSGEAQSFLARFIQNLSTTGLAAIGPDDEYHQAQSPPSGFIELSDAGKEALSAVTGIPQVILFGDTPSGLNTDGDSAWEGFRQEISTIQIRSIRPHLERTTQVSLAAQDGPSRGEVPPDIKVEFRALAEPSDMEQAALRQQISDFDERNIQMGVYSAATIAEHRFSEQGWKADPPVLSAEELADVKFEDEHKKMLQIAPGGGMIDGEQGPPQLPGPPGSAPPQPGSGPPPGGGSPPAPPDRGRREA